MALLFPFLWKQIALTEFLMLLGLTFSALPAVYFQETSDEGTELQGDSSQNWWFLPVKCISQQRL